MELDEAKAQVEQAPAVVLLPELREELAERHGALTQRGRLAEHAVTLLEEGLHLLATLGHSFHLAPGAGVAAAEFPQMLYRREGKENRIVESKEELAEAVKEGWNTAGGAPAGVPPRLAGKKET